MGAIDNAVDQRVKQFVAAAAANSDDTRQLSAVLEQRVQ